MNRIRVDKFALAIEEDGISNMFEKIRFITVYEKNTYTSFTIFSLEFSSLCQSSNIMVEPTSMIFWT